MNDAGKAALFVSGLMLGACGGSPFNGGEPGSGGTTAGAADMPVVDVGGAAGRSGGGAAAGAIGQGGKAGESGASNAAGEKGDPSSAGAGGDGQPASVPCDRAGWTASASLGAKPAYAIDGMPSTRWTTDVPREPGQWFELDFGATVGLLTLELHTELYPLDSPGLVRISFDGAPVAVTTTAPAPGVLAFEFDGKAGRTLRITAEDHGQPVPQFMDQLAWWSIYEIQASCERR